MDIAPVQPDNAMLNFILRIIHLPLTDLILTITYQPATAVKRTSNSKPSYFHLDQNYPNPFNPATTIYYSISQREFVSLSVYDLQGKEVHALVNQMQDPGNYETIFNGSGLTSGIYLCRLQAGNLIDVKKIVLLK